MDMARLQPTTMLPTTTMVSPTPKAMPKKPPKTIKPRKPKLWLYLDYNGVLNEEGTEALNDFLCLVDQLRQDVSLDINLVSKARKRDPQHCNITCNEIADAGVLNVFTKIVFTTERAAVLRRRPCQVEHFDYEPLSPRDAPGLPEKHMRSHPAHQDPDSDEGFLLDDEFRRRQRRQFKEQFHFFHGGKNQFIYSQHLARPHAEIIRRSEIIIRDHLMQRAEPPDRIIFVDDKCENLEAVQELNQLPEFKGVVQCIEMRRKVFRTDWAWHAMSLRSLYRLIQHSVRVLLDDHAVEQRSNPMLQNSRAAPRSGAAEGSGAAPRSGAAEQESGFAWTPMVQTGRTTDAFDL